jgi:hypothetical protein
MRDGRSTAAVAVLLAGLGGSGVSGCKRRAPDAVAPVPAPAAATPAAPAAPAPPADALAADYDPTALTRDGADPLKVYLAEPRTPAWAGAVEEVIGKQLDRDVKHVVPGAGGVSIGCRTLSCLVLVDAPADKLPIAVGMVQMVVLGPVTVNLGPTPEGRGQVLFLTERRMADPATFTSWYVKTRQRTLASVRAGEQPNPLPIPAADLPPD